MVGDETILWVETNLNVSVWHEILVPLPRSTNRLQGVTVGFLDRFISSQAEIAEFQLVKTVR